jgi:hypothetical protein
MDNFIEPTLEDRLLAAKLKVLGIIAAGLLFLGLHYGKSFVKALPVCDKAPYLVAGLYVCVALPFLMAIWLLRVALKAHKHQQMPPPGMLIWTRTRLYRGRAAVVRARLLMLGSAVLLALSLWLVVMVTQITHLFTVC